MSRDKHIWRKARKKPIVVEFREVDGKEQIETREGVLTAKQEEDYIIRGVDGEIYPIKKSIFYRTYEVIEEDMDKHKPKPLNLGDIPEWLEEQIEKRSDLIKYEKIDASNLPLLKEIVFITRIRDVLINEIKQRIRAACEFYLKYKDKPALFSDEQFTIDLKYDRLTGTYIVELGNRYTEYNYWLFKLAFKNILDEELKVYNE